MSKSLFSKRSASIVQPLKHQPVFMSPTLSTMALAYTKKEVQQAVESFKQKNEHHCLKRSRSGFLSLGSLRHPIRRVLQVPKKRERERERALVCLEEMKQQMQ